MRYGNFWRTLGNSLCAAGIQAAVALVLGVAMPTTGFGQGATGAINGTVMDPTGAAVPGAKVVLHNVATTTEQSVLTNDVGRYIFPNLIPGKYTISVSKEGFSTATEPEFTLLVNQSSTHDITLTVGSVTQEVTVTAVGAQVQASSAELGTAIGQREVEALPLNGRNFTQLLALTPGVSPVSTDQNTALSSTSGSFLGHAIGTFTFPSVNGQCNRCNMWLFDGVNNYGYGGNYAVQPILDTIQEFKVQSHNDSAAYGESMGSVINVVTKSGTAAFHGSVWEYLRNDALDARNTFIYNKTDENGNEIPDSAVTPFRQNQFGFTFGGPLIPRREPKTFFFAGYEGFRWVRAAQNFAHLPTPANLAGDLSDVTTQIYDPFSTREDPANPGTYIRDPFLCDDGGNPLGSGIPGPGATPCNKIPSSMINTNLVSYAQQFWPTPYDTGIEGVNFVNSLPGRRRQDIASLRIDRQFSPSTQFYFRDTYFSSPVRSPLAYPKVFGGAYLHGYQLATAVTHTFGDGTKVLNVRFGRAWADNIPVRIFEGVDTAAALDMAGFSPLWSGNFKGNRRVVVGLGISGYTGVTGDSVHSNQLANIYDTAGDLTIVRGRHTFQMGADYNFFKPNENIFFVNQGHATILTSNPQSPAGTGSGLATFLLGVPDSYNRRNLEVLTNWGKVMGFYFQDQWKATSKLQVNVGLRYDYTDRPDYGQYVGNFNTDTGIYTLAKQPPACGSAPCIPGGTLPEHVDVTTLKNGAILRNSKDNWQPRLGLAYRVRPNTAIRASAGWFYDNWAASTVRS